MNDRPIIFTNDLDGVHFYAPFPLKTTRMLYQRQFALHDPETPFGEFVLHSGLRGKIMSQWSVLFHQLRPHKKEALAGLQLFKQAAIDNGRTMQFAALSGREKDKHVMTKIRLQATGHMAYFTDIYLNEGNSGSAWKESVIRRLVAAGNTVVHIDDDLRAALSIARINDAFDEERVLVYLVRNLSNHSLLLKRSNITLPDNVIFVRSFREAAADFEKKLEEKKI